jgi:signal transduction histidine kinase
VESIDAIKSEADNMQSLVESLLFIARNDKGSLKMEMDTFDLSVLMHEIVKETSLIDSAHNIVPNIAPTLLFYGSCEKLKQALRVFIDNAIKYTPDDGNITLELASSEKQVRISIHDNGIGISQEDLPHIFDRFYRADKSRTKLAESAQKTGGTGLGLAIAKIIIEQHRGKVDVQSTLNQGTSVTILLPRRKKESYQEKAQAPDSE